MSNQQKLIDASKVKEWIEIEFSKKFPGDVYGYADGRQSILDKLESKIDAGDFDPIPLPSIKPGDKVLHASYGVGFVLKVRNYKTLCRFEEGYRMPKMGDLEVIE